jgi:hypothetical protein
MVILLEESSDFYEQAEPVCWQVVGDCPWNFGFRQPVPNPYDFSSI